MKQVFAPFLGQCLLLKYVFKERICTQKSTHLITGQNVLSLVPVLEASLIYRVNEFQDRATQRNPVGVGVG